MKSEGGRSSEGLGFVATVALVTLTACASGPAATAEKITRAVDAGDVAGITAPMNADLSKRVTTEGLGGLPAAMQKRGSLQSFTLARSAVDERKYEYTATFEKGAMTVDVAFDPDGKVSYYHVLDGGASER